ncbi:DUF3179 domain-containing protein [Desulfocurvus sp. DL9XJH121]
MEMAPLAQSYINELAHYTVGDERGREKPPSVNEPKFIRMADAGLYMEPQDVVFVEELANGRVLIYPRSVLVHHEVVNLNEYGPRRSVTYCPLTGSVVGIYAEAGPHETSFGTMDMLINSNRVLYDRATNSQCPQLLPTCIKGPLKNVPLSRFPLLWTDWRHAQSRYPNALVLSKDTGHRSTYNRDALGSYARDDTYYQVGGSYFPLSHVDTEVHPKTRVLGMTRGESAAAVLEDEVKRYGVVNGEVGLERIVALYDKDLGTVRVYRARADGKELRFELAGGEIVDLETRSRWNVMGRAVSGRLRGMKLPRAVAVPCMWFAWKAFHPYTRLLGHQSKDILSGL